METKTMRYYFRYDLKDERGAVAICDIECEIEAHLAFTWGDPYIKAIDAVYICNDDESEVELTRSTQPTLRALGMEIATAAIECDDFLSRVVRSEGFTTSQPANHPNQTFIRGTNL
jgi:hypothetical protein